MKRIRRMIVLMLSLVMILGTQTAVFAEDAIGPVSVEWSDLHIDPTGYISWKMTKPEAYKDYEVRYYTVYLDIMANGIWRENYRKFNSQDTSMEINYGLVGIYKFHVGATFVGGLSSTLSEDSGLCHVTEEYIHKEESSEGSSSGPGTSPGPGSSGSSGSAAGPGTSSGSDIPAWAEKTGTWIFSGNNWYYQNNGEIYKNKWACVYNPYAKTGLGQKCYDWFCFDENGIMRTGWYTDNSGLTFYLNPDSDGTRGKMVTGWKTIDGYTYYFYETEGTGYMGALAKNTTINGYKVDAQGRYVK